MATIIDGKALSKNVKENIKNIIDNEFIVKGKPAPKLAVVLVGEDPASKVYVNSKIKACSEVGMESQNVILDKNITQSELNNVVNALNADESVSGILIQLPLPKHLNESEVVNLISSAKDVDGLTYTNLGKLVAGDKTAIKSCTPQGVIEMLKAYNIGVEGKNIVIINRSILFGKPLQIMLTDMHGTVTVCHSRTRDLKAVTLNSDIVITAVGKKNFLTSDMVKQGAVVIDVGIVRDEETRKVCGDVDYENVSKVASFITPVPGGAGPMTIAMLLKNTIDTALEQTRKIDKEKKEHKAKKACELKTIKNSEELVR